MLRSTLSLPLVASLLLTAPLACGGSDDGPSGAGGAGGSAGSGGSGGGSACQPTAAACFSAGPTGPGAACLARQDNSALAKKQYRLMQLQVEEPEVLTQPFMQDSIITQKVSLNQPDCAANGTAQFTVLLEVDPAASTLTVGGGLPQALAGNPVTDGNCFLDVTDGPSGLRVKPETVAYTTSGATLTAEYEKLILPIYLANEHGNTVLLPLNKVTMKLTPSDGDNCVGKFLPEVLDPRASCSPPLGEFAWENAGELTGYITVAEADEVPVVSLNQTLCVILSGDTARWKGPDNDCKSAEDPEGLPSGNWCSTTNAPASATCKDAFLLKTRFAASGFKIRGTCPPP